MGSNVLQIPSFHNPLSKPPQLYFQPLANKMILYSTISFESYQKWQQEYPPSSYKSEFLLLPKKHQLIHNSHQINYNNSHPSDKFQYQVEVQFDCYPYVMEDQMENRKKLGKKFEETQIWYILLGLVEGCWQVGMKGVCKGVYGRSIVFNEVGEIKIVGGWSWPANPLKIEQIQRQTVYQAPQVLNNLNPYNPEKSLPFSIAITILSLLFTQSFHTLYSPVFSQESLNKLLQLLPTLTYRNQHQKQLKYSFDLIRIIQRMTCINLDERLWLGQLKEMLGKVKDQIIGFEDFSINWSQYRSGISTPAKQLASLINSPPHLTPRNPITLNSYTGNTVYSVMQSKPQSRQNSHSKTIPIYPLYVPIQPQPMYVHRGNGYFQDKAPRNNILFHDKEEDWRIKNMKKESTIETKKNQWKQTERELKLKQQNMDSVIVDDQLLARVQRQLLRSKSLFPN